MATAPDDRASDDARWLRHVCPAGYRNPTPQGRYNLVVIGAGQAGLVAATGAAALGARVALVEKERLGGAHLTTVVPRLALTRSARALGRVQRERDRGAALSEQPRVDFAAALTRARQVRAEIAANEGLQQLIEKGIDVYFGAAEFVDGSHVVVDGQVLGFTRALIATGSSPNPPKLPGIETVRALRADEISALKELPRRLAIFGGGAAAMEYAQAFARFGSRVTVYDTGTRVLPEEDAHGAMLIQKALERDGVTFRFGCVETRLAPGKISGFQMGGEYADEFDEILFLTGRKPHIEGLKLEAARVECDEQGIMVSDRLRTTNWRIYAAGDVCARFTFLHASDALARSVVANALFFGTYRFSTVNIPSLTMTDPEIARIGVGEQDEEAKHLHVMDLTFKDVDRARLDDEDGWLRLYYDRLGRMQGATLVCGHAGEMIGEVALAMRHNIRLGSLAADLHPYPTLSEIFKRAGDNYRKSLLTPTIAKFLKKLLQWRR